jgi:hypothetical protein
VAMSGAAGGSEQGLDEKQRVGRSAVIKRVLGAPNRFAHCH